MPVSLPHTEYALSAYYIIAPAEASSNLARYDGLRYGYSPLRATPNTLEELNSTQALYTSVRDSAFGVEVKRRILYFYPSQYPYVLSIVPIIRDRLGTYVLSHAAYDEYYLKATKIRALVARDFADAFAQVNVLLTPTATAFPPPLEGQGLGLDPTADYANDVMTIPASLAGHASVHFR